MKYWLVKQEPTKYSWNDFIQEGETLWTGVRNYQARNYLREMRYGDWVFFYHSQTERAIVGIAKVISESAIQDPTATGEKNEQWVCVKLQPYKALAKTVTLAEIKNQPLLANVPLLRQNRLSVMPLTQEEFETVLALGETKL